MSDLPKMSDLPVITNVMTNYAEHADPTVRAAYEQGRHTGRKEMQLQIQQTIADIGRGVKKYCNYLNYVTNELIKAFRNAGDKMLKTVPLQNIIGLSYNSLQYI